MYNVLLITICFQDLLKHVEEAKQSTAAESQQLQSTDMTSPAHDTVSTVHSSSSHDAVDPKYVQLLGDKATVRLNILMLPVTRCLLL